MPRRPVLLSTALAIAVAVPAMASGILAATGGWTPVIDNAVVAMRAHDVLGGHLPLVGLYSSLTGAAHAPTRLHYLGPLGFWLVAVPARFGGPAATGLALGAAAINALSAAGTVLVAQRVGGARLAALVAFATGVLAWSLGGQVLHDPWSTDLVIFPFLFLLMAACALAVGDLWMLPVVALAASVVAQLHLTYVVPDAVVFLYAIAGLYLTLRHQRNDRTSAESEQLRHRLASVLVVTALVLLACWWPSVLDELAGTGNLSAVIHAALGGNYPRVGIGIAWRDLVHATSVPPEWLHPFTGIVKLDTAPSSFAVATSLLVLLALLSGTVWGWARHSRRLAAVGTVALLACVGTFVTAVRTPAAYHYEELVWARRVWWPVGLFVWIALGCMVGDVLARKWPRFWHRAELPAVAAALVGIALTLVATWPRLGPAQDYGSAGFGAVRTLGPAVDSTLRGRGPWVVRPQGDLALSIVGPGLAVQLQYRGRSIFLVDPDFPDFVGTKRRPAGTLLVVSGKAAGQTMAGFRMVARWDPATATEPFRSYRQTAFFIPIEPVAVYLSTPA